MAQCPRFPAHRHQPQSVPAAEPAGAAWWQAEAWLKSDVVWILQTIDRHADVLGKLLTRVAAQADLVPDAHLAALAIEHGLTLCSTDGDFSRFPDLSWQHPLTA